jgi:hypothetical protein
MSSSVGDTLASPQVEELVGTFDIAGRTKANGSNCAGWLSIGWAWSLVRLDVASELEPAMLSVIELSAGHHFARTYRGGNAAFGRKCVYPEDGWVDKMNEHSKWDHFEW